MTLLFFPASGEEFCPAGKFLQDSKCIECPPGTYRRRSRKDQTCMKCRPGTFQPSFGAVDADLCRNCYPGTFNDIEGAAQCKSCPSSKTSNFGATKCSKCGPGTKNRRYGNGCEPCEAGSYSSGTLNQECEYCPGSLSSEEGSTSVDDCKPCPPGRHAQGCVTCSKNFFKGPGTTRCTKCRQGYFTKRGGAKNESLCLPCPPNTIAKGYERRCQPCRPGTFINAAGASFCRKSGEKCPASHFENGDGDCERCETGFIFNAVKKTCDRCPEFMVSSGGMNSVCRKCSPPFVPDFDNGRCKCTSNMFFNGKTCLPCPAGTDISDDEHTFRECFPCSAGTFKAKAGTTSCQPCPPGLVSLGEGAKKCTKCPDGLMPDVDEMERNPASICVSTKTRCPLGYKRQTVGVSRSFFGCKKIRCPPDVPLEEIGKTCAACDKGFRRRTTGSGCQKCGKQEVSEGGSMTTCTKCPNGLFQDERDRSKCSCYGYFALGFGIQKGVCKKCPPGTIGSYSSEMCTACRAGTFAAGIGNESCKGCNSGTFSKPGAEKCLPCPNGSWANKKRRATACVSEQ